MATNGILKSVKIRTSMMAGGVLSALLLSACNTASVSSGAAGTCPQVRHTEYAPAQIASMQNPLQINKENLNTGEDLFQSATKPVTCSTCHGKRGAGDGPLATQFEPAPRNFTCTRTMQAISDGQMFWIIKNGSFATSMPAFDHLTDEEIWKLIMYVRRLAPMPQEQVARDEVRGKTL